MKLWALIKRLSANLNTFWQSGDSNVDKRGFFFPSKLKCQKVYIGRKGGAVKALIFWQNYHSQSEGTFFLQKNCTRFCSTKARFLIRAKIWRISVCRVCASYTRGVEGEGGWRGGWRENGKKKTQLIATCSCKKCLEKEVCRNSWQHCIPWLEYGNSPSVFHVIPSGCSSVGSYGNVRATRWQSHLTPTSADDAQGRPFLFCSISMWPGSFWQPPPFHLGPCTFAPEDPTSSGYEAGSLTLREGRIW